ncbi:MAG: ribosomal protein S18-alanine N-acetyltransferase [Chloroflexia bacterium]
MEIPYTVEPMTEADIDEVLEIERQSFAQPWSARAFLCELALPYALYLVARPVEAGWRRVSSGLWRFWRHRGTERVALRRPVVGYAGMQLILDEGHITTLAVHPAYRRRGIGALLLLNLAERARERGVVRLTLEVRVSNQAAQRLYEAFGFRVEGRRLRYYGDGEDAWIMWSERLDTPESRLRLANLWQKLEARWRAAAQPAGGESR